MKLRRLIGFLISLCLITVSSSASTSKDDSLLDQSYNIARGLDSHERVYHSIELCRVSAQPKTPVHRAQEWCLELFDIASSEPDVRTRIAGQKNALQFLSNINPTLSMKFVPKIEIQRPVAGQMLWEDLRSDFLETLFQNFLAIVKPQDLTPIIAQAKYVGQTGQYPYRAMAAVITSLGKTQKNAVDTIVSDALTFYVHETGYYNRDEEFLVLLQSLKSSAVDNGLAGRAFTAFVQRLKNDPILVPGDYYAEIHISSGKVFPFTDRNEAFVFEAFPGIRVFTPQLAAQLSQQDPKLNEATGNMSYLAGGFFQGDPTSPQASQQHLQWLQESLVNRIKECQDSNPQEAARLAQRLTDVSSRISGFSAAVPGISRHNPAEARKIYEQQVSDLENLGNSVAKLRPMVALANAAYSIGDSKKYELLTAQAFDMGVQFYSGDKANRAQNRKGFAELQDLVTSSASQSIDLLKEKVQHLPDDWLKAYLLLYEVEGHAKRNAKPPASKACSD